MTMLWLASNNKKFVWCFHFWFYSTFNSKIDNSSKDNVVAPCNNIKRVASPDVLHVALGRDPRPDLPLPLLIRYKLYIYRNIFFPHAGNCEGGPCIRAWSVPELALTHGAWALTLTRALCLRRPGSGPGPWYIPGTTGPGSHNKTVQTQI